MLAGLVAVAWLSAPLWSGQGAAFQPVADSTAAPAPTACKSALTGRTFKLPANVAAFGKSQHLASLPLAANEYILTIDDGPNPGTTKALLEILAKRCVHATFMLVGKKAEARRDLVQAILEGGNTVGSHSFSHANFSRFTETEIERELLTGADAVDNAAGFGTNPTRRLVRVPGGTGVPNDPPPGWLELFRRNKFVFTGWDWAADDWSNAPASVSYAKFFPRMGDRGVILLHDGPQHTLELLPMVLDEIERRGGRILTLAQVQ